MTILEENWCQSLYVFLLSGSSFVSKLWYNPKVKETLRRLRRKPNCKLKQPEKKVGEEFSFHLYNYN